MRYRQTHKARRPLQGEGYTSVMTGIRTHTLLLTTPELESGELDRSAMTRHESYNLKGKLIG